MSKRHNMADYISGLEDIERFVLKHHYPFVFDVNSFEDIVDVKQRRKAVKSLKLPMLPLSGGSLDKNMKMGE